MFLWNKKKLLIFFFLGYLYDQVGFRWSTLFPVGWNILVSIMSVAMMIFKRKQSIDRRDYQEIGGDNQEGLLGLVFKLIKIC